MDSEDWQADQSGDAGEPIAPSRWRRWRLGVTVAAVVVAFAATGVVIWRQQSHIDALHRTQASDVATLRGALATAKNDRASLSGQLGSAQAQLKAVEARLTADEKQLKATDERLPPDLSALASKASPSVVAVDCITDDGGDSGTAFAMDLPGADNNVTNLITAAHVVDACADPTGDALLEVSSGSETWPVSIRGMDSTYDVAILTTSAKLPLLEPAGDGPVVGDFVMAIGNPLGVINNVTTGNVSQLHDMFILDSAPISNGNSGGPVINKRGEVIGIVDAGAIPGADAPVVQNLNVSVRLEALCASILSGSVCKVLH